MEFSHSPRNYNATASAAATANSVLCYSQLYPRTFYYNESGHNQARADLLLELARERDILPNVIHILLQVLANLLKYVRREIPCSEQKLRPHLLLRKKQRHIHIEQSYQHWNDACTACRRTPTY